MTQQPTGILSSLVEYPLVRRIRRNHGLEHATLNILATRFPKTPMAGYSTPKGFWIVGEVPTQSIVDAVQEAHRRLSAGEHNLAIHPNCGTNFIVAGAAAGLAGAFAMFSARNRWRDRLERLPLAMSLATLALIFAQPLGKLVQERVTTTGVLGELQVTEITCTRKEQPVVHCILTRG